MFKFAIIFDAAAYEITDWNEVRVHAALYVLSLAGQTKKAEAVNLEFSAGIDIEVLFFALGLIFLIECARNDGQKLPSFDVTDQELANLVNTMRSQDENKARSDQIELDYQGHTITSGLTDNAKKKLFKYVDSSLLRKTTYDKFLALADNYKFATCTVESENAHNQQEEKDFLVAIFATKIWKTLYEFFRSKRHPFAKDANTFKSWVKQIWFDHYSRACGLPDTSGFEHVFMGESKNGEISGMHNWVRFYQLEKDASADFDYKGFLVKRFNIMAAVKYTWHNEVKRSGSFLIGTSPEFDMALYTLCFLSRRGHRSTCNIELDGCPLSITSFDIYQDRKVFIGSIYPSAGRMTEACRRLNG